ncbi:hypothetical protein OIU76_000238 [Salix suchowensis]|nr:hypothetical protein OIU76_000238 [Salix suchowensis]
MAYDMTFFKTSKWRNIYTEFVENGSRVLQAHQYLKTIRFSYHSRPCQLGALPGTLCAIHSRPSHRQSLSTHFNSVLCRELFVRSTLDHRIDRPL